MHLFLCAILGLLACGVRSDTDGVVSLPVLPVGSNSDSDPSVLHRAKRQGCSDQYSNCNAGVTYNSVFYAALFPSGSGCSTVAGTQSGMVQYACKCTTTCPAFCGSSACSAAVTTTQAPAGPTTTTTTTTTTTVSAAGGLDTSVAGVQTTIVNLHNAKRRTIPSTGMLRLSWDPAVAALAQSWANQCTTGHPSKTLTSYWNTATFTPTGQNVAWGYTSWTDAITGWYSEINNFQFGVGTTDPLKDVGHYTQVVWNQTYAVGCGYKQCPSWGMFVCNYGPAGNMAPNQNYPYLPGTACAACPGSCDNGLCTNPCPYTNDYSNCEVQSGTYAPLYPTGCGSPATGGLKDNCKATCLCKPQGLIYRL